MVLPLVICNLLTSNSIEVNELLITSGRTIRRYLLFDHVGYFIIMLSFMKYKTIQKNISKKKKTCDIDMYKKRHEYLLDVRQSVTVAVQTLNELLMYDKIESDTLKVDKTTVWVLELLETIKTFSLSMI